MRLTNSELQTWRDCPRQWWFRYYMKLGPLDSHINEAKEVGNIYHEVIARGYETNWENDVESDVALLVYALQEKHGECAVCEKKFKSVQEYATRMVQGYVEWLAEEGVDSDLQLIDVERSIEINPGWGEDPYGEPITLLGKLDARFLRESDNFRFFMDHKSVQNLTDRPKWAHLDTQFKFYHLLERSDPTTGAQSDGGVINMARRVKRSATAKPPFYARHEVRHNDLELRSFWWSVFEQAKEIMQAHIDVENGDLARMYPSPGQDCTWKCPFFQACPMVDNGEDLGGYIEAAFIEIDPLERYKEVG